MTPFRIYLPMPAPVDTLGSSILYLFIGHIQKDGEVLAWVAFLFVKLFFCRSVVKKIIVFTIELSKEPPLISIKSLVNYLNNNHISPVFRPFPKNFGLLHMPRLH